MIANLIYILCKKEEEKEENQSKIILNFFPFLNFPRKTVINFFLFTATFLW